MEIEKELILKKLMDPEVGKFIETTDGLNKHKNVKLSIKSREAGNELFRQQNHTNETHEEILNFYSKSIAFAPTESEEIALGYSNRSALLLHLKSYHESILDIEKSLAITSSDVLKVKLLCRKVDCLIALGLPESSDVLNEARAYFNKIEVIEIGDRDYIVEMLAKTKKLLDINKEIAKSSVDEVIQLKPKGEINNFSSISSKRSKEYGHHMIAKRNINPGEIVYIEEPLVVCSGSKNMYVNCNHCLAIAWNGVPCQNCNWSIFCSEKCKKEAWKNYHFVECSVITHLIELNRSYSQNFQMALRAVLMGITESGGVAKLKAAIELMDKSEDGHIHNKFVATLPISSIINDKYAEEDISNAVIALSYAAKRTVLFKKGLSDTNPCNDSENVLFGGTLLLKWTKICKKYAYYFSASPKLCEHANQTEKCFKQFCKNKVSYFSLVSCLMNNSCIPNVKRIFTNNQKILVYALDYIPTNQQIFESYAYSFYETPATVDRKDILKNDFKFDCNCEACLNHWPSLMGEGNDDSKSKWLDSILDNHHTYAFSELFNLYNNANVQYDEKMISELGEAIKHVTQHVDQPNQIKCRLLGCLRQAYEQMYGNSLK